MSTAMPARIADSSIEATNLGPLSLQCPQGLYSQFEKHT